MRCRRSPSRCIPGIHDGVSSRHGERAPKVTPRWRRGWQSLTIGNPPAFEVPSLIVKLPFRRWGSKTTKESTAGRKNLKDGKKEPRVGLRRSERRKVPTSIDEHSKPTSKSSSKEVADVPPPDFGVTDQAIRIDDGGLDFLGETPVMERKRRFVEPTQQDDCLPFHAHKRPNQGTSATDIVPQYSTIYMNDIPGVRLPTALSKFKSWLGLSEALTQRPDTLPEPQGRPPVWANGRQALCETVPYFRAFQGGTCRYNGFVRGFLFDNSCIDRDFMDSNVVIARTSGGMGRKTKDGDMVPIKDQGESSIFEAIMNNMVQHNPVAVISGQQNPKMPSQMPYIYNILDWYKITHVWHEEYNGIIIGRLRLEKLSAGPSWWTPKGGSEIVQLGQLPPTQQTCPECRSQSPQIYLCGWMCVMWKCTRFWTLPNGLKPLGADLRYDPRFLKCHTWWRNTCEPQPLVPDRRFRLSFKDLSSESVKGIVCPECGCCIQRVEWARYKCENEHCSHVYETPHEVIQPEEVQKYYRPPTSYYAPSNDKWGENVVWKLLFRDNYRINIFEVEGGKIAHLIANSTVNEETGGPDDMFRELQEADMGAKRACLPRDQHKGETYMTSFMVNYGMPYKFIAATAEKTFEEAPAKAIKLARSRLIWAVKMLFEQDPGFNELLLVQYMSEQKMDYHDDGEAGLGPIVAAQSLGFGSEMRFRQKAKYYFGVTKSQDTLNERPIQGCFKYEERMRAWLELQTLPAEAKKLRREQLVKELGLRSKRSPMDAITLRLCHGDVVIMVGSKLQKYYEHSVTGADGNIRFALTCRHIDPASLKPEQLPATEVLPDDIHYDGSQLPQVPSPPPPPQPLE